MRVRSVAHVAPVLGISGLVIAALVRCNLPELPPGPQALPTRVAFVRGAFVSLPTQPFDHGALIASMKALGFSTVVIENVADVTGEHVADRVALALELQAALDADVFIGTYQAPAVVDQTFTACYPGGVTFDANESEVDKLVACSKDASDKVAAALRAANAPNRIGCYITTLQPTLVDTLTGDQVATLAGVFRNGAASCVADGRFVGISSVVEPGAGDPDQAGVLIRTAIQDSGVNVFMLDDGVGAPDANPFRAAAYYNGLRNALEDREPSVLVWASVEAYACTDGTCVTSHPATSDRFFSQLCSARGRVDGILSAEYFSDLAGESFVDAAAPDPDAGDADADVIDASDDLDASAQLRNAYLLWVDSGAPCP